MAFSTLHLGAREQELKSTDSRPSTTLSSHSSLTDCPTYTSSGSDLEVSSISRTLSECTSCLSEPNSPESCRFPANAEERQRLSGCIDPGCAETVCDECYNHEECCDDCVADCESDCGITFGCHKPDVRVDNTYAFEGSHSELFGDQMAQTFGLGRRLPPLEMENTMMETSSFSKIPDDTTFPTLPAYSMNQSYLGSDLQPSPSFRSPWATPTPFNPLQVSTTSGMSYISALRGPHNQELRPAEITRLAHNSASSKYPSDSTHEGLGRSDFTPRAHYDHINLLTEQSDCTGRSPPSMQCQWADSSGEPCGKTLGFGNDMHEHLKSAHGVRGEVFCRWIGCSVGVLKASPHRFASSVERHTWGHSGYRPYKCSACNEGFAAAIVRDEHFTNIHLHKKVFSCDMCSHQCTSATNLKRHKDDKHSAERYQCEFCNRYGKRRLFPRGPNLTRHFRNCKYVRAEFPEAATAGKTKVDWLPPGYKRGHHGMDRAKVTPPKYLPAHVDAQER